MTAPHPSASKDADTFPSRGRLGQTPIIASLRTTPRSPAVTATGVCRPGLAKNSPLDCFPGAAALLTQGRHKERRRRTPDSSCACVFALARPARAGIRRMRPALPPLAFGSSGGAWNLWVRRLWSMRVVVETKDRSLTPLICGGQAPVIMSQSRLAVGHADYFLRYLAAIQPSWPLKLMRHQSPLSCRILTLAFFFSVPRIFASLRG